MAVLQEPIITTQSDGSILIRPTQEFLNEPHELERYVREHIMPNSRLVVDLDEVNEISSRENAGVSALIKIRANLNNKEIQLINVGKEVRGVFGVTAADRLFDIKIKTKTQDAIRRPDAAVGQYL